MYLKSDFSRSLFPELEEEVLLKASKESKVKRLAQKSTNFGLEYCGNAMFCGKYGIPQLKPYTGTIPLQYTTFSEITRTGNPESCVTWFDYDCVINRLWNHPEHYVEVLSHYMCVSEPDYSLKVNNPLSVQIANTYRSHAVSYYMQECGVAVLPCMSWSSTASYDFCFDGHSKGGVVLVSTIGTIRDERSRMYFRLGFLEMLKRISPDSVILYGDVTEDILFWLPKELDVHHFEHNRYKRARRYGK